MVKLQKNLQQTISLGGLVIGLALPLSTQGFAQLSTASINGIVRDSSGAVIVLRNVDSSVENTTVTSRVGAYVLLSITPENYLLEATASGFAARRLPVFTLTVSRIAAIDFSLSVGHQTSAVIVQGVSPQLEVASATLGTVIGTQQVNDLPLNGRNFTQLLCFLPVYRRLTLHNTPVDSLPNLLIRGLPFQPSMDSPIGAIFLADGLSNYGTFYKAIFSSDAKRDN